MKDSKTIVAVVLSIAVLVIWQMFFAPNPEKKPVGTEPLAAQTTEVAKPATAEVAKESAKPATETSSLPLQTVDMEGNLFKTTLTNDGAVADSWTLSEYPDIDLAKGSNNEFLTVALGNATFEFPKNARFSVEKKEGETIFTWTSKEVVIEKIYRTTNDSGAIGNNYGLELEVKIKNISGRDQKADVGLLVSQTKPTEKSGGFFSFLKSSQQDYPQSVYFIDGDLKQSTDLFTEQKELKKGNLYWAAVETRYFISAIVPRGVGPDAGVFVGVGGDKEVRSATSEIVIPQVSIYAGDSWKQTYTIYSGPKDINQLKVLGVRLEEAIDYGWTSFIAVPILYCLKFFYKWVHNYGIAIILLTIFIKLLMHPINKKSMKSMKAMQLLQPQLKELKDKYGKDRERLNLETMALFKRHHVNPMGGCLPMLLQLPVYFALYKVLWSSIELYRAPFFWFYKDLSAPDPYFITPIILGVSMALQQKLTPSASADPTQQKMMMIMPVMFAAFMLFLPSGLVIYILVNTVISVTQQYMMNNNISVMDLFKKKNKVEVIR